MRAWRGILIALVLLGTGLLIPQSAAAQALNGNALFVASEQVLAVPTKNGNTLQALLSVNVENTTGHTEPVVYQLPAGGQSPRIVASSTKNIAINAQGELRLLSRPAGVTTFAVEFHAPLNQNGTELTWQENLPVRKLFFVIPEGALTVSAQGGFQTDSQSILSGGQSFRQFTKLEIPANSPWTVAIALLPTANGRQAAPLPNVPVLNSYSPRTADLEAIGNLLLVVVILALGIVSIRRGSVLSSRPEVRALTDQKMNVLERWADLEAAFSRGEIQQAEYQERRDRLKKRAVQLEQMLRQGTRP